MDLAHQKYKIAENHNEIFSLVMVDIDFFKKVNDTYGHQCGDIVLQEFAKIFKESIRSMDVVARYGGEEFIIILLTNRENAFKIVEQIRKKVEAYSFGKQSINLTASFGIAQCNGKGLFSDDLKRADDALYRAKENGRNRIELA
jgi:diguanylate cyclase (GGDEF)-like protein